MFDCLAMGNEQVWRKQLPVTVTFDEKTFLFLFPLHTLILLIKILLALKCWIHIYFEKYCNGD